MNARRNMLLLVAAALTFGAAPTQGQGPYLAPDKVPDGIAILPPPPVPGSPAAQADAALFNATRKLQGTPRWRLAQNDVSNAPLDRFACALGLKLTPGQAPALARLLDRAGTGPMVDAVKRHYAVPRPYRASDAPICEPKTAHLAANGDYPSGHAANGWLEGLILAELAPDRATAILARARAYGESRAICGSHTMSAVEAGRMAGTAMFAVLHGAPRFRADMQAARRELERLRASAPTPAPALCADENGLLSAP